MKEMTKSDNRNRGRPGFASLILIAGIVTMIAPAEVVSAGPVGCDGPALRAWQDPDLYRELSGAARTMVAIQCADLSTTPRTSRTTYAPTDTASLVNDPTLDTTVQDTQSETTLVMTDDGTLVSAFNDSASYLGPGSTHFTGYATYAPVDGAFTDQGALPDSVNGDAGDPVLARDTVSGRIYLATLDFATAENIQIFRSDDDGVTFAQPVSGTPGFTGSGYFQDKEWIAVDNFAGSGQGNVYLSWTAFGASTRIKFTRSTDGGDTWSPSGGIDLTSTASVQGSFVTVGPDHTVYVAFYDGATTPARIRIRASTDQGQTFEPTVTVSDLVTTTSNGNLQLNGGFRSNSFPHAAVNPINGDVYVVFNDKPSGDADVFLACSSDGGATWTSPMTVNDDATTTAQFFPTIAVTPDGEHVFTTFYDRRNDPSDLLLQRGGRIARVGAGDCNLSFGDGFTFSPQFPPVIGQDPVINATYMGDYDQAVANNTSFFATWGDNRDSAGSHANQPDVRWAEVPVTTGFVGEVAVTTPAGGERWPAGKARRIRWTFQEPIGNDVTVELLRNGSPVRTIKDPAAIGAVGVGSLRWRIPRSTPKGRSYQIRITSTDDGTIADTSATFRISSQ